MTRLMEAEFFKLRQRMMTWILALLLVGLIVLIYSVLWSISGRVTTFGNEHQFTAEELRRALFLQTSVPFSLTVVSSFGLILAAVLAAGAAGSEYSWGTVRLMATASKGRLQTMAAKLIVVSGLVAAGALLAVIAAVIYSSIITFSSGGSSLDFVTLTYVRDQFASYGRTLFVMAPYVALAFAAAVIGRSTLAGVGSAIGFAFIEPLISGLMRLGGSFWQDIPRFLMNSNIEVIVLQNKLPDVLPSFGPSRQELANQHVNSPQVAAIVLAVYIVAFIALALYVYRRRDITAT
jgi:ABC-2 type transport system permease protein